jgi:hypothetical protein
MNKTNPYDVIDASLKKMMSDGKIDASDVPEMVMLITTLSAHTFVPKSTEDLGKNIDELYTFVMNKYDLFPKSEEDRAVFDKLFKSSLRLVLYQPLVKSKCDKFWGGLGCK